MKSPQAPPTPDAPSSPAPVRPTASMPHRKPSYLELLRQQNPAASDLPNRPYLEQLERLTPSPPRLLPPAAPPPGAPGELLHATLVQLLDYTLASGSDTISGREIFWRLRVPPSRQKTDGRVIARVLRSLGWVRCRYGGQGRRIWGWRWREGDVAKVKIVLPAKAAMPMETAASSPLPVRAKRPPIIPIYGDDVPLAEATPEGVWRIIRPPLGPRLQLGRQNRARTKSGTRDEPST